MEAWEEKIKTDETFVAHASLWGVVCTWEDESLMNISEVQKRTLANVKSI